MSSLTSKQACAIINSVKTGCLFGAALPAALKAVYKFLEAVLTLAVKIIIYLGLYIPLIHIACGGIMSLIFDFKLFDGSLYSSLYIVGFVLSIIASIILSIRSGISKLLRYRESKNVIEYHGSKSRKAPEAPKIYKSRVNKGMIVYEYENRFDLYEDTGDRLLYAGTEYKKKKGRRW